MKMQRSVKEVANRENKAKQNKLCLILLLTPHKVLSQLSASTAVPLSVAIILGAVQSG
jgi:hypothetical protein